MRVVMIRVYVVISMKVHPAAEVINKSIIEISVEIVNDGLSFIVHFMSEVVDMGEHEHMKEVGRDKKGYK